MHLKNAVRRVLAGMPARADLVQLAVTSLDTRADQAGRVHRGNDQIGQRADPVVAVGERAVDPASRRVAVQVVSQAVSLLVVLAGSPAASQGISQRHKPKA